MNIPDEVQIAAMQAGELGRGRPGDFLAEYTVIAKWARKEALREAEKAIRAHQPEYPAREDHDYYALGRHDGFAQAAAVTRALEAGDAS